MDDPCNRNVAPSTQHEFNFNDFISRLNYQNTILNPSVINEAMDKIKQQLSTQQLIELINGSLITQQDIAEKAIRQIQQTLNNIKSSHLHSNSPSIQPGHDRNNIFEDNSDCHSNINLTFEADINENDNDGDIKMNDVASSIFDHQSIASDDSLTISELSQLPTLIIPDITPQQIFENNRLSQNILDYLDDITISVYAQINKECHQNTQKINQYIDINSNDWLFQYIMNGNHAIKHINKCKNIILDFTNFDEMDEINQDFLISTLDKMQKQRIFQNCNKLSIISPSTFISRILPQTIGSLNGVKELYFKNCEIFPMIKMVTQIPCKFSLINKLSMIDIDIKRDEDDEKYTDSDKWMIQNINANIMHNFIERIMECNYIAICGWKNEYDFWMNWMNYLYKTFDCSNIKKLGMTLQHSLKKCAIKELVYLPKYPKQDRIPHKLVNFLLKYKGYQIEKLTLNFAGSARLYHAAINKTLIQNLEMYKLKELCFGWNDRDSYKLLNCIINKAKKLEIVKLFLPQSRDLCKLEEKTVATIKRKCDDVCVDKGCMFSIHNI